MTPSNTETGDVAPSRLHRTGSYPSYTWRNGADVLAPDWLSANIYPTRDGSKRPWTIRFFGADMHESYVQDDLWSLRMVRAVIARVDAAYAALWAEHRAHAERHEQRLSKMDGWYWKQVMGDLVHQAWLAAADLEIALINPHDHSEENSR